MDKIGEMTRPINYNKDVERLRLYPAHNAQIPSIVRKFKYNNMKSNYYNNCTIVER